VQARQILIARRLVERGVRFIQLWHGAGQPWDNHDDLEVNHRRLAGQCDQAIGALLKDLKRTGLLDETLVIWGGEFGRTPTVELPKKGSNAGKINGRDHNHYGFTVWMAGGGVRGGYVHGATDEFGFQAVENRVHVHDLHATILRLMGFDHERFTYRYAGRDFRLTDVHGRVVERVDCVIGRPGLFLLALRGTTIGLARLPVPPDAWRSPHEIANRRAVVPVSASGNTHPSRRTSA
jgi:hypothetical protein